MNKVVTHRLLSYIDYHKKRDPFFSEAVPEAAVESRHEPRIEGNSNQSFQGDI